MDPNTIVAVSSIVTPISVMVGVMYTARVQHRTNHNVNLGNVATNQVVDAVNMSNGQTIAEAVEEAQARDNAQDADT